MDNAMESAMETYFASPYRSGPRELRHQVEIVTSSPVIDGIMQMVGGLIAVLNENRQILSVNQQLLNALGVDNPEAVMGLRPGEAVGCRYATEMAAGCGTSEYCMNCGAVIAIVTSLGSDGPVARTCAISAERNGRPADLFFRVHAAPLQIEAERFVLLFLYDISRQQRLAALERVFFHDINNTVMGLLNASELLKCSGNGGADAMAVNIVSLAKRLSREVELQRRLSGQESGDYDLQGELISVEWIINEVEHLMIVHPAMKEKVLQIQNSATGLLFYTDISLVLRVLENMLINACEAAASCHTIKFNLTAHGGHVTFCVWNAEIIAPSIASRIFQRNFSTKDELGRGLGTYSMKLIGEQLLGGRVFFESSAAKGTTFYLALPIKPPK